MRKGQVTQHPSLDGNLTSFQKHRDSRSKLSISSRKVLSQPAAELPFPPAPCQSKKWAKDLHNSPPSTPSTVIFIYFKINVRGMSELWAAQGAEKLRTLLQAETGGEGRAGFKLKHPNFFPKALKNSKIEQIYTKTTLPFQRHFASRFSCIFTQWNKDSWSEQSPWEATSWEYGGISGQHWQDIPHQPKQHCSRCHHGEKKWSKRNRKLCQNPPQAGK